MSRAILSRLYGLPGVPLGQGRPRQLTVRPQAHHETIQAARQRQETAAFKAQYAQRAGIEGTHAQAIRRCGLRRCRYIGQAKTHLQPVIIAMAINIVRMAAWLEGTPLAHTRPSPFAALAALVLGGALNANSPPASIVMRFGASSISRRHTIL
jgi:hypothetical protein